MYVETSNLAHGLTIASTSPWMTKHPGKGRGRGHVNHLNFSGHQPYLWNGCKFYKSQHMDDKSPLIGMVRVT